MANTVIDADVLVLTFIKDIILGFIMGIFVAVMNSLVDADLNVNVVVRENSIDKKLPVISIGMQKTYSAEDMSFFMKQLSKIGLNKATFLPSQSDSQINGHISS